MSTAPKYPPRRLHPCFCVLPRPPVPLNHPLVASTDRTTSGTTVPHMTTQTETRLVLGRSLRFWGITLTIVGVAAVLFGLFLIPYYLHPSQFSTLECAIGDWDGCRPVPPHTRDLDAPIGFMIGGVAFGVAGLLTTVTGVRLWVRHRHG